jgi:hypothetical protein
LQAVDSSSGIYPFGVSVLKRTCLRSGLLPAGCFLHGDYTIPELPASRSAFSDVFRGQGYGKELAVKVLRVHADERDRIWKVCAHVIVPLAGCRCS